MKIILDTDFGDDIDDTFALYYLLKKTEDSLALILSDFGQTKKRAELLYDFLKRCGKENIPIGIGIEDATFREPYMYRFYKQNSNGQKLPFIENGLQKAKKLIEENDDVVIIAIGPATNLAALSKICPKAKKVPVYAMFGSIYKGYSGSDKPGREWNVIADVPSAQKTLAEYENFIIAPLDSCGLIRFEGETYKRILASDNPVVEDYKNWLKLGFHTKDDCSSVLFDTMPVYMLLDDSLVEYKTLPLICDDEGNLLVKPNSKKFKCALNWKDIQTYIKNLASVFLT